jgi:hypothetical protein
MKSFTALVLCFACLSAFSQQASKKTFLITANSSAPLMYNRISSVDISTGKLVGDLYESSNKYSIRNNGSQSYQLRNRKDNDDVTQLPMGGSVACLAYDAKSERLFYVPLQLSELRYMDLKESSPSFTCLQNQSINLLHGKDDVANQITRMAIGANGTGYALSNDGEHLIKFTTTGTPVIQDLGVLIDNPKNQVMVRSSCTSWGGDMVAAADGSLYLITLHNHIFKISLPSKQCDYIGTIKNLPEEYTSNGASVDENGELVISCGTSYGKKFSPFYKVKWPSLEATSITVDMNGQGNVSDMASSNLLFQKATKEVDKNSVASFTQTTIETQENNLPNISIFPNPVNNGKFQVRTNNLKEKGDYKLILLDASGKSIMEGKMNLGLKSNTNSFSFPARHAKGVYFIQIADTFNRTIFSQQIIVE